MGEGLKAFLGILAFLVEAALDVVHDLAGDLLGPFILLLVGQIRSAALLLEPGNFLPFVFFYFFKLFDFLRFVSLLLLLGLLF